MISQRTLKPRTIFCHDNLSILRGINSASVDLIYLDPPFNKGRDFHAPIGTSAEGAEFTDIWAVDSVKDEWHNQIIDNHSQLYTYLDATGLIGSRSAKYYLIYMAVRLMEMHRILKDSGSIYLHCDPTASHYLKLLMDTIFGHQNYRNEITWKRAVSAQKGSQHKSKQWGNNSDVLLFYVKSAGASLNPLAEPSAEYMEKRFNLVDADGRRYHNQAPLWRGTGMGERPNLCYEWRGFVNPSPAGWRLSKERLEEEYQKGNIVINAKGRIERRKYLDDYEGLALGNLWSDIAPAMGKERIGYPTQKPLALLERIVGASSNKGDLVLDPFCGCATTCIAAERLQREWVGIDVSAKAFDLVKMRLNREVPPDLFVGEPVFRQDIPTRTDIAHKRAPTKEDKQLLYGKQSGRCKGCAMQIDIRHLEVDHIIPRADGGSSEIENLQLLCGNCNRIKGNRPMEYLAARLKQEYGKRGF